MWIFYVFSVLFLLCLFTCLFICALWSPVGKGLTSWLSFVVSNCEFVTFPLVSCVRCGTWLYWFLIFAPLLTMALTSAWVKILLCIVVLKQGLIRYKNIPLCWSGADTRVCYFPIGILCQVWYLIVSIPYLCTLTYYGSDLCLSKNFAMHSCAKTGLNPIQEYPLVLEWGRYQSTGKSERHPNHFYS